MVSVYFSLATFGNCSKIVPKYAPDCPVLFGNFIWADELFAKSSRSLETSALVNNNLCEKLYASLELQITSDERSKVTSVQFFIPNFNLLSC